MYCNDFFFQETLFNTFFKSVINFDALSFEKNTLVKNYVKIL